MRGSAVLTRTGALSMLLLAMVFTFACSTVLGPGKAQLPAGIDEARVPDVDHGGFFYVRADPPLPLTPELFRSNTDEPVPGAATTTLALRGATIVAEGAGQEFGGVLHLRFCRGRRVCIDGVGGLWGRRSSLVEGCATRPTSCQRRQQLGRLCPRRPPIGRPGGPCPSGPRSVDALDQPAG